METEKNILQLNNVCKNFGGVVAAKNVSFQLHSGEILGLIGPNGAGKTTLLNLISGIYETDSGTIEMAGQNITRYPSHKRARMGLARTFQTPRFLQKSDIRDNLFLGLDLADKKSYFKSFFSRKNPDFEDEVNRLMEIAHIQIDWGTSITAIPYGTLKLMEIVRAMLEKPKVMLVDEPAAGLNGQEIEYAVDLLREAAYSRNVGVILIEHSMDMVMNVCHNIVVLNFGELICHGTPEVVSSDKKVIEAYLGRDYDA